MKTFIVVLAAIALQGGFLVEAKRFDARKVSDLDIFCLSLDTNWVNQLFLGSSCCI